MNQLYYLSLSFCDFFIDFNTTVIFICLPISVTVVNILMKEISQSNMLCLEASET